MNQAPKAEKRRAGRKPKAEDDRQSRNCVPLYLSNNQLRKLGLEKREVGPLLKRLLNEHAAKPDSEPTTQNG